MADPLILASSSPRRRELMCCTGIPFEVDAPEVDEECNLPAELAVAELSRRKASAASLLHPGRFILASDTLVCLDSAVLGKPADRDDAARMLHLLSGRTHQVFTGVTVMTPEKKLFTEVDVSHVTFDRLTEAEIDAYIASGEPLDKAGSYGIQGMASLFISHMDGSFYGVMGLPLYLVRRLLVQAGYPVI